MAIKLGDNDVKLYLGDNEVNKVYLGDTLVYPDKERAISKLYKFRVQYTSTSLSLEEVNSNG